MECTIQNFRGIASARLDLSKICLLAGQNEAGKTSVSQAFAAALTGEPVPIPGVKKAQAGMLVRSGTASGNVELVGPAGMTHIDWPAAKVKTEGQAPFASHFAAGMQSIVNLEDKERVKILTEYLRATPTKDDLAQQLADMNLPANVIDQLWQLIESTGWDNAASQIKEKGARLKGQWENVTGDRYGSKKAESWLPNGWDNDLMGQSDETLRAVVTDARDSLEASIASNAVDDSRRAELEALAALVPEREKTLEALKAEAPVSKPSPFQEKIQGLEAELQELAKARADAQEWLNNLPPAKQPEGAPCPHCGKLIQVQPDKSLSKVQNIPQSEIVARHNAIEETIAGIETCKTKYMMVETERNNLLRESQAEVEALRKAQDAHRDKVAEANRLLKEATAASEELSGMADQATGTGGDVESFRKTLSLAENRLKAFNAKTEADRLHHNIDMNSRLLAKILPDGIRGDVLTRALKGFNERLAPLCKAASWRPVSLENDFMPTYGGTIYLLLSESAKFRVRTILQMGMALADKSQALVIDAADILDKGGRNGLFKAVKASGLPTLVSMTIDSKEQVPNLAKAGIGVSYWLNDAVTEAI